MANTAAIKNQRFSACANRQRSKTEPFTAGHIARVVSEVGRQERLPLFCPDISV
jgi:hypothetical protein